MGTHTQAQGSQMSTERTTKRRVTILDDSSQE